MLAIIDGITVGGAEEKSVWKRLDWNDGLRLGIEIILNYPRITSPIISRNL